MWQPKDKWRSSGASSCGLDIVFGSKDPQGMSLPAVIFLSHPITLSFLLPFALCCHIWIQAKDSKNTFYCPLQRKKNAPMPHTEGKNIYFFVLCRKAQTFTSLFLSLPLSFECNQWPQGAYSTESIRLCHFCQLFVLFFFLQIPSYPETDGEEGCRWHFVRLVMCSGHRWNGQIFLRIQFSNISPSTCTSVYAWGREL